MKFIIPLKWLSIAFFSCISVHGIGQKVQSLKEIQPPASFENVHVQKMTEDSLQTCFVIWIKQHVKGHFHQWHTENIIVLEGKAQMKLGLDTLIVKPGDHINIPKNTPHAVLQVLSRKPLKVLSIQSPAFDGTDRVFVSEP
jgi:mannose-6-phosphate isomerase-like protein (cupin superfamily)